MSNFNNVDLIDIVESFAEENGLICCEDELSEIFDETVLPHVLEMYGEDDAIAINEAFNNWSDGLCRDGDLHQEQYANYCYVGKYA